MKDALNIAPIASDGPHLLFYPFFIGAYLIGSVNSAVVLFKLRGHADPRSQYSHNAGATNVYRQAGWAWALAVLLGDIGKAALITVLAQHLLAWQEVPWIGLAMIIGNRFPCWHGFRGGKGVAHYIGFTTVIAPVAAMAGLAAWVVAYGLWRIPFIASIVMLTVLGAGMILSQPWHGGAFLGVLITIGFIGFNHKANILELRQ